MGLDTVELVIAVEDEFEIRIPDGVAETLVTVGALHAYVENELNLNGRPRESEAIFEVIRTLIIRQNGIDAKHVTGDARFVQDLGFD